ncbi:MgtC/SapB family protein [Rubricoccus marinus]|uniref:Uncharacterized protein n=1 Tax=Rubricoccus marinus TaxID=716817 RepID=A0A259U2D6_9BACT|nr:MgtC/SapB family protein [Rubricoccus marinus]OZC04007.1 hypothetical protein BSZ36_14055 [Rubricoccus marinus]
MLEDPLALFGRLGAALAIGLLVGTQREFQHRNEADDGSEAPGARGGPIAGIRTFPLVALAGGLAAVLGGLFNSPLLVGIVVLIVGAMAVVAYRAGSARGDLGLTTEVALVVTALAGALCVAGPLAVAAGAGVAMAVLLELKPEARRFVRALDDEDISAALKFAAVSALILPILPDETYGPAPFNVVSPFKVWLMVVFISGISFLGYVLVQVVGPKRGVGITGIVGGLASSTAVTLSFAERSQNQAKLAAALALGIVLAWTVMFARVLVEAGAVNPALLAVVWPAIVAGGAAGLLYAGVLWWRSRGDSETPEEGERQFTNPFELKSALAFGALYALILVGSKAAEMYLGTAGIYASAIASGLADVDAVTLTMAELSRPGGSLSVETASRAVVLAAASNTVVKGGIVLSIGAGAMKKAILPGVAAILAAMLVVGFLF